MGTAALLAAPRPPSGWSICTPSSAETAASPRPGATYGGHGYVMGFGNSPPEASSSASTVRASSEPFLSFVTASAPDGQKPAVHRVLPGHPSLHRDVWDIDDDDDGPQIEEVFDVEDFYHEDFYDPEARGSPGGGKRGRDQDDDLLAAVRGGKGLALILRVLSSRPFTGCVARTSTEGCAVAQRDASQGD